MSVPLNLMTTPWDSLPISLAEHLIQTGLCIGFYDMSLLRGSTCVLINDCTSHVGKIVALFHHLGISC